MLISKGCQYHLIPSTKFKDITFSFRFLDHLTKENATCRSLLALMMIDSCHAYPSKSKMSTKMDQLYGATLNAQTLGYGGAQVLEIRSKLLNPAYVKDHDCLYEEHLDFLKEIIFYPRLEEDLFVECKQLLLDKMNRSEEDPATYCLNEALKEAGKNYPLGVSSLGDKEILKNITLDDIRKTYENLITKNQIDIIICGDIDENKMMNLMEKNFNFKNRNTDFSTFYTIKNDNHVIEIKKEKDISQTSISMIWFTDTSIIDQDYYALRLACGIFGQYPTSYLFQEVREKKSLCYSIYSSLISYDGVLMMTTGVEKENTVQTMALVSEQMERVRQGDFSDEMMEVTKKMMITSLKATNDECNSMIGLCYQNVLTQRNLTTDEIIDQINKITKDDIVKAINKCDFKASYVLTQGD